jgi:hypothetical protein
MLDGVTDGPLTVSAYAAAAGRGFYVRSGDQIFAQTWWGKQSEAEANARFIAWARESVPALAAERDKYRAAWQVDMAALAEALLQGKALAEGVATYQAVVWNMTAENERLRKALVAISEETNPPPFYKGDRQPTRAAQFALAALKGDTP